jgi:dTDP-6-deoxy-L-talose 4-dehydrogenase (NAD+)
MDKIALVTGASGFVGKHVCNSLSGLGYRLRLIVRNPSQASTRDRDQVLTTPDLFKESLEWLSDACAGVDLVIHLAWHVDPADYLSSDKNLECTEGTLRLARAANVSQVRRFVGIGTCFEYDLSAGVLSTSTPLKPASLYGSCKAATFFALSKYFEGTSTDFLWCRLFYLYGEGEKPGRLVPYVREQLSKGAVAELTSGKQIRDFMNVGDAAELIATLARGKSCGAVNICSGVPKSVRELAEDIADEYGSRNLLRFGARKDNAVDPLCIIGVRNFS